MKIKKDDKADDKNNDKVKDKKKDDDVNSAENNKKKEDFPKETVVKDTSQEMKDLLKTISEMAVNIKTLMDEREMMQRWGWSQNQMYYHQ